MGENEILKDIFPPGTMVMVQYVDTDSLSRQHSSRIRDIEGSYLVLEAPLDGTIPVQFFEGQELTIKRIEYRDQQIYITNVFVIEMRPGKLPLLVCSKPHVFNKASLRRFSRFSVDLAFNCSFEGRTESGQINDLSMSGCNALLKADLKVAEGSPVALTIFLPEEPELILAGKVVRVFRRPGDRGTRLAFVFSASGEEASNTLRNYLFQHQLLQQGILGGKTEEP